MEMKLEPEYEAKCKALWTLHLRHPGIVQQHIVKKLKKNSLNNDEVIAIRMEWQRLLGGPPPQPAKAVQGWK